MRRLFFNLIPVVLFLSAAAMAQLGLPPAHRPGMTYVPGSPPVAGAPAQAQLDVRRIRGETRDRQNLPIPMVELGLFTATPEHKLLAVVRTGEDGKFDFGKHVPAGSYRLIVQYPGLCTVNIPVRVGRDGSGKKIVVTMQYPGLDVCSYARLR